jgi:hypothetical protein
MRMKMEDVRVDDPDKAMQCFRSTLTKVVKAPKIATRSKHEHADGHPRKIPKR